MLVGLPLQEAPRVPHGEQRGGHSLFSSPLPRPLLLRGGRQEKRRERYGKGNRERENEGLVTRPIINLPPKTVIGPPPPRPPTRQPHPNGVPPFHDALLGPCTLRFPPVTAQPTAHPTDPCLFRLRRRSLASPFEETKHKI
jgi:hypothetical protein